MAFPIITPLYSATQRYYITILLIWQKALLALLCYPGITTLSTSNSTPDGPGGTSLDWTDRLRPIDCGGYLFIVSSLSLGSNTCPLPLTPNWYPRLLFCWGWVNDHLYLATCMRSWVVLRFNLGWCRRLCVQGMLKFRVMVAKTFELLTGTSVTILEIMRFVNGLRYLLNDIFLFILRSLLLLSCHLFDLSLIYSKACVYWLIYKAARSRHIVIMLRLIIKFLLGITFVWLLFSTMIILVKPSRVATIIRIIDVYVDIEIIQNLYEFAGVAVTKHANLFVAKLLKLLQNLLLLILT